VRVEEIKRGVWEAGGFPVEMPAMIAFAENVPEADDDAVPQLSWRSRPKSCCARIRPTACVLMGGCDKTTPGPDDGRDSA
jgi:dihydroxyacid dehydratase/phosphogluconate dehydratase